MRLLQGFRFSGSRVYILCEFPKIGDPNIIPKNSRSLIVRTPKIRYPYFGNSKP